MAVTGDVLGKPNSFAIERKCWQATDPTVLLTKASGSGKILLDILLSVLAPVPTSLIEQLTAPNLLAWRTRAEQWKESTPKGCDDPTYEYATGWVRKRQLASGHLLAGPRIWARNDGTHIHLEWDNRRCQLTGTLAWTALLGNWKMPVQAFLEAVRTFDEQLIQAMQLRVEQMTTSWSGRGIHLDQDNSLLEQADRSTWLAQSLARVHQEQALDWNPILSAVTFIDAETKT
jgi:hypothetical protein